MASLDIIVNDTNITNNSNEEEMCGICLDYFSSITDTIITLKCKHRFCYQCIYESYINSKEKRQCPYCRKNGGYLPLPESATPTKYIHKEYVSSKLPSLPLYYSVSHYKKPQLIGIAKKIGITLLKENGKKKLKKDLYIDINKAYKDDNTIVYKL